MVKLDVRGIGAHVASLTWVALRSFLGTTLVIGLAGLLLAGLSYCAVRHGGWVFCVVAVVLVLVESLVAGVILGANSAVSQTLALDWVYFSSDGRW